MSGFRDAVFGASLLHKDPLRGSQSTANNSQSQKVDWQSRQHKAVVQLSHEALLEGILARNRVHAFEHKVQELQQSFDARGNIFPFDEPVTDLSQQKEVWNAAVELVGNHTFTFEETSAYRSDAPPLSHRPASNPECDSDKEKFLNSRTTSPSQTHLSEDAMS
jgi:uncharacterized protein YaaR (DUF327 family)